MKPCRRCGGEKAPGPRRHLCDECQQIAATERAHRSPPLLPCSGCGGPKDRGRGTHYCSACVAERVGVRPAARPAKRVPVERLREPFLRSGMTVTEVARALDWYDPRRPDASRARRAVGLSGPRYVNPSTAVRVGSVLGLAPVDMGL